MRTLDLELLGTLALAAADRGGVLAARLSKERAQADVTMPIHEGATRFLAHSANWQVTSGNP